MNSITSVGLIPTARVSGTLISQQLSNQVQSDETALQQLETQVSTGKKLILPSDDPTAAIQAFGLQDVINQKTQISSNVQGAQSYLNEADSALQSVTNLLSTARAAALSVSGTTASDPSQLQAIYNQIAGVVQQLVAVGNQSFNGRYLFSGSLTGQQPFQTQGTNVLYSGNAGSVATFSDINQLFQTNVSGAEVFGALSNSVQGTATLTAATTAATTLASLNGGQGVSSGSIKISDGTNSSTIDLSGATTLGDVAALIESHPPAGDAVRVDVTPSGLKLTLSGSGGANLSVSEVGSGHTAAALGILAPGNSSTSLTGTPLNPTLTPTTLLSNLLGTKAQTSVDSSAANSGISIQAQTNGSALNGYALQFVDHGDVTAGNETVSIDNTAKTITVDIAAGFTTANQVVTALNNSSAFSANFTAGLDPTQLGSTGFGAVDLSATGATSGGGGAAFDQDSGLQITNGGQTYTVSFSGDQTVGDLLNTLNGSPANVLAQVNAAGTGLNITSRVSGAPFSIGENGGQTATQLGVRTLTGSTFLSQLNNGAGASAATSGNDFAIQLPDGTELQIALGSAKTVQDVINLINNSPSNQGPGDQVTAQLTPSGNGIQLTTTDTTGTAGFAVIAENGSQAAQGLGLIPSGASQSSAATTSGGVQTITGSDVNTQQGQSLFTALINLQNAVQNGDSGGISSALNLLGTATQQVNFAQAEVGAREQALTDIQSSLSTQQTDLQQSLSNATDVDMATAITNLTQIQASFQATLEMAGQLSQLTLMNFLPPL